MLKCEISTFQPSANQLHVRALTLYAQMLFTQDTATPHSSVICRTQRCRQSRGSSISTRALAEHESRCGLLARRQDATRLDGSLPPPRPPNPPTEPGSLIGDLVFFFSPGSGCLLFTGRLLAPRPSSCTNLIFTQCTPAYFEGH